MSHQYYQFIIIMFSIICMVVSQHALAWLRYRPEMTYKMIGNLLTVISIFIGIIIFYELLHFFKHA